MNGRSEFPVEIGRQEIIEITNKMQSIYIQDYAIQLNGPDLATALTLRALEEFLRDRRCEPDFKVVLK
jgi:hypothetical protein